MGTPGVWTGRGSIPHRVQAEVASIVSDRLTCSQPADDTHQLFQSPGLVGRLYPCSLPLPALVFVEGAAYANCQHGPCLAISRPGWPGHGASRTGCLSAASSTAVPRRTRLVRPATAGQDRQGLQPGLGGQAVAHPHRVQSRFLGRLGQREDGVRALRPALCSHNQTPSG